jgi:hypothetical protein
VTRPPHIPILATAAACLLAALAAACGEREPGSRPPGSGAPGSDAGAGSAAAGRPRVVVIGIDGADWQVIDPLVRQGRLPAFRRLIEEGATGPLRSMEPSASPALWTTVATGVGPERHGIHGFVVPAAAGIGKVAARPPAGAVGEEAGGGRDVRPVTSGMRRAPAFWNILGEHGKSVGVVGWLVTWPAEPVHGFVVSSYLPYLYSWSTGRPLKGTIVAGLPRQTFPEGLIDELEPLKVKPEDLDGPTLRRFYDPARTGRLSPPDRECVEGFLWSLACDETYRRIGLHLFSRYPVDLFAIYFGGVDVASHRFWKFAHPEALDYGVRPEEAAILGRVIDEYYVYVDGMVGEYLGRLGPQDTLVVLSDHGFKAVLVPGKPTTSGHHRDQGILAIWGRGARRGARFDGAGLLDVLPTILGLLEVPIARDLQGRALEEAFDRGFARQHPPRFVDAYAAAGAPAAPDASDLDRNVLERLRSLGYIN